MPTEIIGKVDCAQSRKIQDFNNDGHLDLWSAERRLDDSNPAAKNQELWGNFRGEFIAIDRSMGFGLHESGMVDLEGGDAIIGKPWNWQSPSPDIRLNEGQ